MALPLPEGKKILVTHKKLSGDYRMPSLEAAYDHYSISFLIHGDRRVLSPTMTYAIHAGSANLLPPYVYHQTVPDSQEYYECIQVKFSPPMADPITEKLGSHVLEQLYENPVYSFSEDLQPRILSIMENMLLVQEREGKYMEFTLQQMLCELLMMIFEFGQEEASHQKHSSSLTEPILNAIYYMETNYAKQIKIKEVADVSGYSTAYFSRLFQSQLGYSFSDYLCNIRLRHIKSLLMTTDMSVTDIALETGFQYPGNMTGLFRQKTGMSPNQFRKSNKYKQV